MKAISYEILSRYSPISCNFKYANKVERFLDKDFTRDKYPPLDLTVQGIGGCYIFFKETKKDKKGIPLYVGRTINYINRFYQYSLGAEWVRRYFSDNNEPNLFTFCRSMHNIRLFLITEKQKGDSYTIEKELIRILEPVYNIAHTKSYRKTGAI